jgi:hypothetical protein
MFALLCMVAVALVVGIVITPINKFVPTGYLSHIQLVGDANTYTTGGFPLGPASFGFVDSYDDVWAVVSQGAFVVEWIPSTNSLRVQTDPGTGLAEVANNGSTSGLQVDLYAFGR